MWEPITVEPYKYTITWNYVTHHSDFEKVIKKNELLQDEKDMLLNDLKAKRDLIYSLTLDTFRLLNSLQTSNQIWK